MIFFRLNSVVIILVFSLTMQLYIPSAIASIIVSPMIINFKNPSKQSTTVAVKNVGNAIEYVEITPYKIKTDKKHEKETRIVNPKDGLLVFPSKITLFPKETQYVRILATHPPGTQDQNYMVKFIPRIAGLNINKNVNKHERMGLHLILGYGVRVIVRPKKITPNVHVKKQKNGWLRIQNTGNTSLIIAKIYQKVDNKKQTIKPTCFRVLSGKTCSAKMLAPNKPAYIQLMLMHVPFKNIKI